MIFIQIKNIQDKYLKFINNSIIFYDIKLSNELIEKLKELSSKPSLTDEEYINKIILLKFFNKIASINLFKSKNKLLKLLEGAINCSNKYCYEFKLDKELQDKKQSIIKMKNDKKRNEFIKEVYSNEKQIKLDKCNKDTLKFIQESLKFYNDYLKLFDIEVPKDIQMSNIIELKENDIPKIVINFYHIF